MRVEDIDTQRSRGRSFKKRYHVTPADVRPSLFQTKLRGRRSSTRRWAAVAAVHFLILRCGRRRPRNAVICSHRRRRVDLSRSGRQELGHEHQRATRTDANEGEEPWNSSWCWRVRRRLGRRGLRWRRPPRQRRSAGRSRYLQKRRNKNWS